MSQKSCDFTKVKNLVTVGVMRRTQYSSYRVHTLNPSAGLFPGSNYWLPTTLKKKSARPHTHTSEAGLSCQFPP